MGHEGCAWLLGSAPASMSSPTNILVTPHITMVVSALGAWPVTLCSSCSASALQDDQCPPKDRLTRSSCSCNTRTPHYLGQGVDNGGMRV